MLSWYMDLSPLVRTLLALLVLGVGTYCALDAKINGQHIVRVANRRGEPVNQVTERPGARDEFRLGVFGVGFGTVLLMVCGKSSTEKKGYRF